MNTELIARLEAAEVGGNALSIDVLEALTGGDWKPGDGTHRFIDNGDGTIGIEVTPVTTSLDATLALAVRTFGEKVALSMLFIAAGVSDNIKRLPINICIAILRALDAKQEGA